MNVEKIKQTVIPNTVLWSAIFIIVSAIATQWVSITSNIATLEKEIEILKVRVARSEEIVKETDERYSEIQKALYEIKNALNLKQDKRFAE